jgi:predicted RNA-binding protein with PUA-like domain
MDHLLKTEPTEYSFAELQEDGEAAWDSGTNPTAVMHLREMKPSDRLVIYETGKVRDVWNAKDLGAMEDYVAEVPGHGVVLLRVK